jgi:hypothetical protein
MARLPRRRYLLIPFLYVTVILGLLALALFGRGFAQSIGEARLSGRYAALPLFGSREVRSLTLSYNGLSLRFSRRLPLLIGTQEQAGARAEVRGLRAVQLYSAGADVIFENDTRLRIAASPDGSLSLSLAAREGQTGPPPASLVVPFRVRGTARRVEGAPVLSWERRGASFILTLPAGSRFDEASRTIALSRGSAAGGQEMRLTRAAGSTQSPYASWLSDEASRVSADDLQKALTRFTDAAYRAWSGARLAAGANAWKMPDGTEVFDERIAAALLAESVLRGTYQRLRPVMAEALAQQMRAGPAPSLTLSSSAYVGSLREYTRRVSAGGQAEVERVRGLLSRSDPSLLETARLVPTLLDHGPFALVPEVVAFAGSRDPKGLGLPGALGLLETLLDYSSLVERTEASLRLCGNLIEARLLPSIRKTDSGIFLGSGTPNAVDVRLSIRCGSLLARAGAEMDMQLMGAIGRGLLVSALAMADETAALPARLTLDAARIASKEGSLLPEELYALLPLPDSPRAREIPLYGSLGPGAWIWTAAQAVSVEGTAKTAAIALSFPVGLQHYAVVQGIAPFTELRLHGIPWRTAVDYAQYSDGWLYDGQTTTLYLKLTGRVGKEEILITY